MKPRANEINKIINAPPENLRFILLYGPDSGLITARAQQAVAAICPDSTDPFRISRWSEDQLLGDPPKLADDINALAMMGGRRVIRIQPAGDKLATLIEPLLTSSKSDTLVVALSGELPPRSKLRKLAEASPHAASVPCYEDNASARRSLVQTQCKQAQLNIDSDALDYLVENLGSDHGVSRQELEKLLLYMGPATGEPRTITLEHAHAVIGDTAAWRIDDIADAMLLGSMERLERNFQSALQAGAVAIRILNAVGASTRRIHALASQVEQGETPSSAIAKMRPPIPFFRKDMVAEQLRRWPRRRLDRALRLLSEAELECKSGAGADISLCRQAIWRIAAAGNQSSRRVSSSGR
ncbi:MAG: DNA polymerase III subunit delta [Hyphomicrobiales bacterium]|nr:DNA polymerase III subunit delta [Hyphomicrobiales bacterium]